WLEGRFLAPPSSPGPPFTAADVRATGEWLERTAVHLADKGRDSTVLATPPAPAFAVAGLRALCRVAPGAAAIRHQIDAMVLELDPDHPVLARETTARNIAGGDRAARNAARRLVELYPQQGKIHLLFTGDDVPVAEELG